jgi:hypothetical protein
LAVLFVTMPFSIAVSITTDEVKASGMNSCSNGWYHVTGDFKNYCPFCGHSGCLRWNPKGTKEGEFTCGKCGADFCICGRCKATGSQIYLTNYVKPKPVNPPIEYKAPTKWDYLVLHINQNIINEVV